VEEEGARQPILEGPAPSLGLGKHTSLLEFGPDSWQVRPQASSQRTVLLLRAFPGGMEDAHEESHIACRTISCTPSVALHPKKSVRRDRCWPTVYSHIAIKPSKPF
jgi:hypothetical protein